MDGEKLVEELAKIAKHEIDRAECVCEKCGGIGTTNKSAKAIARAVAVRVLEETIKVVDAASQNKLGTNALHELAASIGGSHGR